MTMLTRFEKWDPFDELSTLRNRMDRLFARFGEDIEEPVYTGTWMPTADIYETKDAMVVKTELPGMTEKDIDIELENNILTISGERKFEEKKEEKGYQRFERKYGRFVRAITLPVTVLPEKIGATYNNGILEVTIPKKEEAKPKKIKLEIKKGLTAPKAA